MSLQQKEAWQLRLATIADIGNLEDLIPRSVRALQAPHYTAAQMDAALGRVFAVDRQLIVDGTCYVAEIADGTVVGSGGWSRRQSLYGGDADRTEADPELNPLRDSARIRAFFVDPAWARRGIGSAIMQQCEAAIKAAQFHKIEIVATLAGELLYATFGYEVIERFDIPLTGGLTIAAVRMSRIIKTEEVSPNTA